MAYRNEEIEEKFSLIIQDIEVHGKSLRQALEGYLSSSTFYQWIDEDEEKAKRYARACEARADKMFDELIDIADKQGQDVIGEDDFGNPIINHNIIARNRLQVEARKWALSKLAPKKYGDKLDVTSDGERINIPIISFDPLSSNETDNSTT